MGVSHLVGKRLVVVPDHAGQDTTHEENVEEKKAPSSQGSPTDPTAAANGNERVNNSEQGKSRCPGVEK